MHPLALIYATLRDELAQAYAQVPWRSQRIDELANRLLDIERLMSRAADDEQCDDSSGLFAAGGLGSVGR